MRIIFYQIAICILSIQLWLLWSLKFLHKIVSVIKTFGKTGNVWAKDFPFKLLSHAHPLFLRWIRHSQLGILINSYLVLLVHVIMLSTRLDNPHIWREQSNSKLWWYTHNFQLSHSISHKKNIRNNASLVSIVAYRSCHMRWSQWYHP